MTKVRNLQVDNSKGILIFLVVLGHAMETIRSTTPIGEFLYLFIYMFHMPVFIYFSGYVSKNMEKGRKNAVKNFLVPFLVLNIIWSLFRLLSTFFVENSVISGRSLYSMLTPAWTLWYILALFVWKILLPDLSKIKRILVWSIIIGLLAGLFTEFGDYLSLSRIIKFTPFFMMGYFASGKKSTNNFSKILSLGVIILTIMYTVVFQQLQLPAELLWWDRSYLDVGISDPFLGIALSGISYLIGFLWIYTFRSLVTEKKTRLSMIGQNTLSVYFLHTYCLGILFFLMSFLDNEGLKLGLAIVTSAFVTYVLSREKLTQWVTQVINKINHLIFSE